MICRTPQRCLESRVKILATGRKRETKIILQFKLSLFCLFREKYSLMFELELMNEWMNDTLFQKVHNYSQDYRLPYGPKDEVRRTNRPFPNCSEPRLSAMLLIWKLVSIVCIWIKSNFQIWKLCVQLCFHNKAPRNSEMAYWSKRMLRW